jgi:hypothetical protein
VRVTLVSVEERYRIGSTESVAVSVLRHEGRQEGYPQWSTAIGLVSGDATVSVPGHYASVLAGRLRVALGGLRRPSRDEYLDLTAVVRDGASTLVLSSTARSPVRVSVELPAAELEPLAGLLDAAADLIETLRPGIGIVPDRLPDRL